MYINIVTCWGARVNYIMILDRIIGFIGNSATILLNLNSYNAIAD
jgi:hypothetical protein